MLAERSCNLLVVNNDRYFSIGLTKLIHDKYPDIVLKQEIQDMDAIDYLLISPDSYSDTTMKVLSKKISKKSKVVLIDEKSDVKERCRSFKLDNLNSLQSKGVTSRDIGKFMTEIIDGREKISTLYLTTAAHVDAIFQNLTPQEILTIKYMWHEPSLTRIAHKMKIHPKTVSHYKRSIMIKLGFKNNIELYNWIRSL